MAAKISTEQAVRMGFLLAVLTLGVIGVFGYWLASRSMDMQRWVNHTHSVAAEIERASLALTDAESASRGFVLSGDPKFLRSYDAGSIRQNLDTLRRLTADNPSQQQRLNELQPLVEQKLAWMEEVKTLRSQQGLEPAAQRVSSAEGDHLMTDIQRILSGMEKSEAELLEVRTARARRDARFTAGAMVAGSIVAVALLGAANLRIRSDLGKRRRAEEQRDQFFNVSKDLLCIAGFDGYFKTLNPVWEQLLGYSTAELMARPFIDFVHPEDRPGTVAAARELAVGAEITAFQNRYRCKDGSYRWLSWNARSSLAEKLIFASARDVSQQRASEEHIARLNRDLQKRAQQLEAANHELESFSYSVSHDLRAPLRHLSGFVDLLGKHSGSVLDEKGRHYIDFIASAARQMGRLVDDLLSFSRMGRTELRHGEVQLGDLVDEARRELQPELAGREVQWQVSPLPTVKADRAMLRVALMNLLSNAVKYTRPKNRAMIELGEIPGSDEHVIFVRDNGVGFDMKYSNKLFNVFQRLHHEDEFEGTGIGLANVRRVIQRHGGRVWAEAKEGEGASFFFSLPKTAFAEANPHQQEQS